MMPYCSETPTYSRCGPFVEVQYPAKARPAFHAIGLRLPDVYRGDQLITEPLMVSFAMVQVDNTTPI
jgi:hypothetical protein